MFGLFRMLLGLGGKAAEALGGNAEERRRLAERQLEINAETERAGAGRLTPRKLLMYMLCVVLAWELMGRPVVATYWPHTPLPPSMLKEIMLMSASLFGFGF